MARFEWEAVFMYKVRAYCEKCSTGELVHYESYSEASNAEILHKCSKCGNLEKLEGKYPKYVYRKD